MAFHIPWQFKNKYKKYKTRNQFCPVSVPNPLIPRRTGHQENVLNLSWHRSWALRLSSYLLILYQSLRKGHAASRSKIHNGFRSWLGKYTWMLGGKSWLNLKLPQLSWWYLSEQCEKRHLLNEILVKQLCWCQSRYLRAAAGLTCLELSIEFGKLSWNGHPPTSNTRPQEVPRSMADVGQKTLVWCVLFFFPSQTALCQSRLPLKLLPFIGVFSIPKHGFWCTVWCSFPVHLDPVVGHSHQDQWQIKQWSG